MRSKYSIAQQAVLDYIDVHGPVSTPQIMRVGLDPRALFNLVSENHLILGPTGYTRGGEKPSAPARTISVKTQLSGESLPLLGLLPVRAHIVVADWPLSLGNLVKKALKHRYPSTEAEAVSNLASQLDGAKKFGSARMVRKLAEVLENPTVSPVFSTTGSPHHIAVGHLSTKYCDECKPGWMRET